MADARARNRWRNEAPKPLWRRPRCTIGAAGSLLLAAFVSVTGTIGFREESDLQLAWVGQHRTLCYLSDRGAIAVIFASGWPAKDWVGGRPGARRTQVTGGPETIRSGIVIDAITFENVMTDGTTTARVRYRALRTNILYGVVLTLVLPSVWLISLLRDRLSRASRGLCTACGYDLRASLGRCPECGQAVDAEVAPAAATPP